MAPQYWADAEQLEFLRSRRSEFLESQKKKSLNKFWNALDRQWFEKWPEPGTDAALGNDEGLRQELGLQIEKKKKVRYKTTY